MVTDEELKRAFKAFKNASSSRASMMNPALAAAADRRRHCGIESIIPRANSSRKSGTNSSNAASSPAIPTASTAWALSRAAWRKF